MERAEVDCVVIGAGVIGLACARRIAHSGREVLILEGEGDIGSGVSARNSEVIHAGIYYPTGSLKARLCVAGRDQLYAYCADHGVTARKVGKLVVATASDQIPALHKLMEQAEANGVDDLKLLSADEAKRMEPQLSCVAAFHSPSTGIIDTHGLMLSLLGEAEARGAALARHAPVERGWLEDDGRVTLQVGGADPMHVTTRVLVNAASLGAQRIARQPARLSRGPHPAAALCEGQLLQPQRTIALLAPDLPDAGSGGPRRPPDARPCGPGALRSRRRMDRSRSTTTSIRAAAMHSTPPSAPIGRSCATALCSPLTPASVPRSRHRAQPPPTSASTGRRCMACPGRCICMASSLPGLTSSLAIADEVAARLGL